MASKIDPLYLALLHQRHHDYEKCADVCTKVSKYKKEVVP